MALPPHIIWERIKTMPEGPEKERKKAWFHAQMKVISIFYPIAFFVLAAGTIALFVVIALGN